MVEALNVIYFLIFTFFMFLAGRLDQPCLVFARTCALASLTCLLGVEALARSANKIVKIL